MMIYVVAWSRRAVSVAFAIQFIVDPINAIVHLFHCVRSDHILHNSANNDIIKAHVMLNTTSIQLIRDIDARLR